METTFGQMMEGFPGGMSEEERKKMTAFCETMAAHCPCAGMKDTQGDAMKSIVERMKGFCHGAEKP